MTVVDGHQQTSQCGQIIRLIKKFYRSHVQYEIEEKSSKISFKALSVKYSGQKTDSATLNPPHPSGQNGLRATIAVHTSLGLILCLKQ